MLEGSGTAAARAPLGAAGGAWHPDHAAARRYADSTLARLDLSRPGTIVLWAPGTSLTSVNGDFRREVERQLPGGAAQLTDLDYPATWHLRDSVATGTEALRLVLDEIQRRGVGQRVVLAGESQGAWIVGEVMADPRRAAIVDRAVLMGHPNMARTHYAEADDPWAAGSKVVELNNADDHVARDTDINPRLLLNSMSGVATGDWGALPSLIRAGFQDPGYAIQAGVNALRGSVLRSIVANPHDYGHQMRDAVALLRRDPDRLPL